MIELILGALIASLYHGTYSFEDCRKNNFKPKACVTSKVMDKASKK
jgi:hypothetical protein